MYLIQGSSIFVERDVFYHMKIVHLMHKFTNWQPDTRN